MTIMSIDWTDPHAAPRWRHQQKSEISAYSRADRIVRPYRGFTCLALDFRL